MTDHTALFGLDPFWVATVVFVVTYSVVISEKVNRAIAALLGAALMVLTGVLTQEAAFRGVDFNTIGLLLGMMTIVNIMKKTGVFQYVAIWSAKKVHADPWRVLLMLAIVTAVFSAFLDNVTTVLLTVPITLQITQRLKVSPYPFLFSQVFASNIGGTATLIGDPPNIMIGSAAGLTFNDFVVHLTPVILVVMAATLIPLYFIWGRKLHATDEDKHAVMTFEERKSITDSTLLKSSLAVLVLVMAGFVTARTTGLEPATIAMGGAALLLLLENVEKAAHHQSESVAASFAEVEWITLMFFSGLFIVVAGVEHVGLIRWFADKVVTLTHGNLTAAAMSILWASAILSAIIDNIPFVAAMIPLIKTMGPGLGGEHALLPLWVALSLGACLGGNGTLIGASANLVVAGMAEKTSTPFRFIPYMKVAFPLMLMSILICMAYMYWRYL